MNQSEFRAILAEEKRLYLGESPGTAQKMKRSLHKRYCIWEYLTYFRYCQYYRDVRQNKEAGRLERKLAKWNFKRYEKKKNLASIRAGVEIGLDSQIGRGCDIWHSGVVINGTVGEGCVFHGNNIIGNKGIDHPSARPVLGDRVDVGAGATVIGDVMIADSCIIGAGAVVTKSFEEGSVIVGIPGKAISK